MVGKVYTPRSFARMACRHDAELLKELALVTAASAVLALMLFIRM